MNNLFFVCHRHRAGITKEYAKTFYNENKNKDYFTTHSSYKLAYKELKSKFYDDSDYIVIKKNDNIFTSCRWGENHFKNSIHF